MTVKLVSMRQFGPAWRNWLLLVGAHTSFSTGEFASGSLSMCVRGEHAETQLWEAGEREMFE